MQCTAMRYSTQRLHTSVCTYTYALDIIAVIDISRQRQHGDISAGKASVGHWPATVVHPLYGLGRDTMTRKRRWCQFMHGLVLRPSSVYLVFCRRSQPATVNQAPCPDRHSFLSPAHFCRIQTDGFGYSKVRAGRLTARPPLPAVTCLMAISHRGLHMQSVAALL